MSGADDFGSRPFVAGSLTGLRAFRVTPDGLLTGIFVAGYRLTPDVNHAECAVPASTQMFNAMSAALRHAVGAGPRPPEETRHQLLSLACRCGFYAYFDGANEYMVGGPNEVDPRVAAVVEGFGKCVVGERGFRAEKLRLVALIRPVPAKPQRRGRLVRARDAVATWLTRHPRYAVVVRVTGALALAVALVASGLGLRIIYPAAVVTGAAWAVAMHRLIRHGWRLRVEEQLRMAFGAPQRRAIDWNQLLANYPDVPVYPTTAAALAAHPLTVPEKPEGEPEYHRVQLNQWFLSTTTLRGYARGGFVQRSIAAAAQAEAEAAKRHAADPGATP